MAVEGAPFLFSHLVDVYDHIVTGVWGDVQHDGYPDLYMVGYVSGKPGTADYLFINEGNRFSNQLPDVIATNDTDHGVQWADFDQDGDGYAAFEGDCDDEDPDMHPGDDDGDGVSLCDGGATGSNSSGGCSVDAGVAKRIR